MDEMTIAEVREAIASAERAIRAEIAHELSLLAVAGIYPHAIDVELVATQSMDKARPQYHLTGVRVRVEVL